MLLLTRHGQTQLNSVGRFQGWMDSPLTERGRSQAHRVGEKLQAIVGTDRVVLYVSPLGRAQETASIIRDYVETSSIKTDDRIKEIGLGDWEGMTMEDIEFTHPGLLDGSSRFDWAYRAPGGESQVDFLARLRRWLGDIEIDNALTVAVSHGWAGMGLRSEYIGKPFDAVTAKGDSHEAVFKFSAGSIQEL